MVHVCGALPKLNSTQSKESNDAIKVSVFEELLRVAGCSVAGDVRDAAIAVSSLSSKEVDEIRTLHNPPVILRRTLEATWLLLNASRVANHPAPPTWAQVQKMLADAEFFGRMHHYDMQSLRNFPSVASFVVAEYFGLSAGRRPCAVTENSRQSNMEILRKRSFAEAGRRSRQGSFLEEPLTVQRVHRASHAASALFRWCTTILIEVMDPEPERRCMQLDPEVMIASFRDEASHEDASICDMNEEVIQQALPPIVASAAQKISESVLTEVLEPLVTQEPQAAEVLVEKKPRPLVIEKVPPAKPLRAVVTAATRPDRHFEIFAEFEMGNAGLLASSVAVLQSAAAMWCMRQKLRIELQACPAKIEHDALSKMRIETISEWFAEQHVKTTLLTDIKCVASGQSPGVSISLHLDQDRSLKEYFLLRDIPDEDIKFPQDVTMTALILEEDFKTCKH